MNLRFLIRELGHSRSQSVVFVFCVMLSLISTVAVNSFRSDVRQSIAGDAKTLHGADVIVHSHQEFSPALEDELNRLVAELQIPVIRTWEFYSVARKVDGTQSLLSNIKVVEKNYPHYGIVELMSGRELNQVLKPGETVVAAALLERFGLGIGDSILLGDMRLVIADVIRSESMRPVDFFNFGPRIFVSAADLDRLGLVKKGSRVNFGALLKTSGEQQVEMAADRLQQHAVVAQERVTTYKSATSRIKRFFDNLLFFLALISVFTLVLAGIGMQSSLSALLRRKRKNFAILRSLGATGPFLLRHYTALVLVLTLFGCALGVLGGAIFEWSFVLLFKGLLPDNIVLGVSFADILESIMLGLLAVTFFTYLPLREIREVKPAQIFRREDGRRPRKAEIFVMLGCGTLLLCGLIIRQLEDIKIGLYFVLGVFCLILVNFLLAGGAVRFLTGVAGRSLALRQAVRSLVRPGNATRSVVVTLASALAVLISIYLIENNLHKTYISSYPAGAPNLFCLDIQKDQRSRFLELAGHDTELFPIIRARLVAINSKLIERDEQTVKRGDSLTREFNLTYRKGLLDDEILLKGNSLFGENHGGRGPVPVSLLDTVAEMGDMRIGDILDFNIQGVPVQAVVSSIRSRTKSMLYPFFYFVFQPEALQAAPQTFFAALMVDQENISGLENEVVNAFPNVSTINVSATAAELGKLMRKLGTIINFFAAFSILAGGLILVSSILATRMERIREAVYYKILGGSRKFVFRVFFMENLLLAFLSGCCGVAVAQLGSWLLCTLVLDLDYDPAWLAALVAVASTVLLVTALGMLNSLSIINRKPARFLAEQ